MKKKKVTFGVPKQINTTITSQPKNGICIFHAYIINGPVQPLDKIVQSATRYTK